MEAIVVFCTVPNNEVAERIATNLVRSQLAACVNIIPHLTSIYTWKNELYNDSELLLVIKTKKNLFPLVEEAIKSYHPYEIAEIIALPVIAGSSDYIGWIYDVTK